MIVEPEQRVPDFIKAGADIVSVHCEQSSTIHLHRTVNQVRFMLLQTCIYLQYIIDIATRLTVKLIFCCITIPYLRDVLLTMSFLI